MKFSINPPWEITNESKENGIKEDIDYLVQKFATNDKMKKYIVNYLTLGFSELNEENILKYIDLNYNSNLKCDNYDSKTLNRLERYNKIKKGNLAPEFTSNSIDGEEIMLSKIKSEYTLICFWASWCPHCLNEMPKLNNLANRYKEMKILSFNLDTTVGDLNKFLELNNMVHFCDQKSWLGNVSKSYYINATPTMILLDKNKKIINEIVNVKELEELLNQLTKS